jgi:hypothetical protein
MPKLSDTPRTDKLGPAVEFMRCFRVFHLRAKNKTGLALPYQVGSFYVKVFQDETRKKVFCFVDLDTGGVLRPNGNNGPLGSERGNIYKPDFGSDCISAEGPQKMKAGKPKGFKHTEVIPRPSRQKPKPEYGTRPIVLIRIPGPEDVPKLIKGVREWTDISE